LAVEATPGLLFALRSDDTLAVFETGEEIVLSPRFFRGNTAVHYTADEWVVTAGSADGIIPSVVTQWAD